MSNTFTIWCNGSLSEEAFEELRAGVGNHTLLLEDSKVINLKPGEPSPLLARADIAFGQPNPSQAADLNSLKWIHLTSAGYTVYDTPEFRKALTERGATLTNSSTVYGEPCAQHLLALMLGLARQLPQAAVEQANTKAWEYERLRARTRVLQDENVLILGFGAIGRRLAELLNPFRVTVRAVRREPMPDDPDFVHPVRDLDELLRNADHVVNSLPSNPSTNRLIDAEFISKMKPGAFLYNVGRGSTVDQDALAGALISGHLSGAYLDVTDPEPLPSDHFLWTTRNCFITPHLAGGRQEEMQHLVRHFLHNLRRFESGQALLDKVF
jgi:phosphoglycerate dehydrogenase-like enzyme